MRVARLFIVSMVIVGAAFAYSLASSEGRPVTPYGDTCSKCGQYGTCKSLISHKEAERSMTDYYRKKGLQVKIGTSKGRFMKARITDSGEVVDVIIFDRKTGRIRSVY